MTTCPRSASSRRDLGFARKARELSAQFAGLLRTRAPWSARNFDHLETDFNAYEACFRRHAGIEFHAARVMEIGCGQRPYRLFYLAARGLNVSAIELERVAMSWSLSAALDTFRANGLERAIKTFFRGLIFDPFDNKAFRRYLAAAGAHWDRWPIDRITLGSAGSLDSWPSGQFDFIFSEDVFEHMPLAELRSVCLCMHQKLRPGGIAWVKPLVFSGIQGGHAVDWYDVSMGRRRRTPPWDHLRGRGFPANTYLNELRIKDYRDIFSGSFDIVEERVQRPGFGKEFLTEDLLRELSDYTEDELLSNGVVFVLRRR